MEVMNMVVASIAPTPASWVEIWSTKLEIISHILIRKNRKGDLFWRNYSRRLEVFSAMRHSKSYQGVVRIM
jgi:hypothetical protein